MDNFPILILFIAAGFFVLHFVNQALQKKFIYQPNIQFFFLGILIGEPFVEFINHNLGLNLPITAKLQSDSQLNILIALMTGFAGFSIGVQLKLKELLEYSSEHYKLSLIDSILTISLMSGISYLLMKNFFLNITTSEIIIVNSLIAGIVSLTLSSSGIRLIQKKFKAEGNNSQTLLIIPKLNNFTAVLLFGLLYVFINSSDARNSALTPVEWFVINILVGLLLGFLSLIFLEKEENENKLLLSIIGIIILSSGFSYYLSLSPIFTNLLIGILIGNLFKTKNLLDEASERTENFLYIVLLIYAGAVFSVKSYSIFIIGLFIYLIIRYFVKYLSGWIAHKSSYNKDAYSSAVGLGLNSQGFIAIAIALNFLQTYRNPITDMIFAVLIAGVLANEILSAKMIKNLLIDLNEIK